MKLDKENKNKADIIYNNIKDIIGDKDPKDIEQVLNYVSDITSLLNPEISIYIMNKLKKNIK
tara:strand:- start:208 stop:393 length:186 start_codon:yes stop_codon:yes gene_type:complete